LEAFAPALREVAAPDVVWREDPRFPGAGTFTGVDAIVAHLAEVEKTLRVEQTVEGLERVGNRVLTRVRWHGVGGASGAEGGMEVATLTTWRDGRNTLVEFFFDRDEARARLHGS
jgi:ketosteroid isomerase-like protein